MNLRQMRQEVMNLCPDGSYDADTVDEYINQCLIYSAAEVAIPSLKRLGVVTTVVGREYVSIGTIEGYAFNGVLRRVSDSDGNEATIHENLEALMNRWPSMDNTGDVTDVALEGNMLWYQKSPSVAENLTLVYYSNPDRLTADADTPEHFPEHLHRKLFVNGAAWMIWDQKEEGVDQQKPNTVNYFFHSFDERNKHSGITKLREHFARRRVHHISSVWSY